MSSPPQRSYAQILRSSSIVGGAQGLNLVIGMVRTKLAAILLGTPGVGLLGFYQSVTALTATVTGLGIGQSAVREVAEAQGTEDPQRVARTIAVLRRACWITAALGTLVTGALAWPISLWAFESAERVWSLTGLSLVVLWTNLAAGHTALLQGLRRIGDLARLQVVSAVFGTVGSVGFYAALGEAGIVPALILVAASQFGVAWWLARRVPVVPCAVDWQETRQLARRFVALGLAFMWSAVLAAAVALVLRTLIVRGLSLEAGGVYQAAWGLSGLFAGFILSAMGADFYPRLTAVAADHPEVNRLVNEQTEIGILLALPGLLGTLVFSPWLIRIFYTANFLEAADLLPWLVLGVFGRVVSWPIGFVLLAKGASRTFAMTETIFNGLHLLLAWLGLQSFGLIGVGVGFALMYACCTIIILLVVRRLTGFRWSQSSRRLLLATGVAVLVTFALCEWVPEPLDLAVGACIVVASSAACVRRIIRAVGEDHRLTRRILRLPVLGRLCTPRQAAGGPASASTGRS